MFDDPPHVGLCDHLIQREPSVFIDLGLEVGELGVAVIRPELWTFLVSVKRHEHLPMFIRANKACSNKEWWRLDDGLLW